MNYDELADAVNLSYSKTNDVRTTLKQIRKIDRTITFNEVWEMIGFKDYFDFVETDDEE